MSTLNSDRFLDAYAKIERHLRSVSASDRWHSFYHLVDTVSKSNAIVRRLKDDLKEFADLRNAIIHERSDSHVIAEPNDQAVADIERIASLILDPPKVIPLFQTQVITLAARDSIATAVKVMLERSFSRIPIYDGEAFLGLLTTNAIARWLGSCSDEDLIDMNEVSITHVLDYTEHKERYCFLSRDRTVFEALSRFQEHERQGKRLEAILITQTGKPSESLLGIMTVWDVPRALKEVESRTR